jgi:hypothetical protein
LRIGSCLLRIGQLLLVTMLLLGSVGTTWSWAASQSSAEILADSDQTEGAAHAGHSHTHDHDPSAPDHVHEAVVPDARRASPVRVLHLLAWRCVDNASLPGDAIGLERPPRTLTAA